MDKSMLYKETNPNIRKIKRFFNDLIQAESNTAATDKACMCVFTHLLSQVGKLVVEEINEAQYFVIKTQEDLTYVYVKHFKFSATEVKLCENM